MRVVFAVFALFAVAILVFFFMKSPERTHELAPMLISLSALLLSLAVALGFFKKSPPADENQDPKTGPKPRQFRLAPSFKSAFLGGLIGGGSAGLINGVVYYLSSQKSSDFKAAGWDAIGLTFVFALVSGGVFGAFCQFLILILRHARTEFVLGDLIGGLLGGGIAGAVMGLWAGWAFGERNTPPPNNSLVFWGGILCGFFVVLGALLYEYRERGRTLKRTLFVLAPVTIIVGAIGVLVLSKFGENYFIGEGADELQRGLIFGAFMGILWGFQLGLTHLLYRLVFKQRPQLARS